MKALKYKYLQKFDEVIQSRIEYVMVVFIAVLFIAGILIIIWIGPLELHRQLSIP